jgi:hypothetical protein
MHSHPQPLFHLCSHIMKLLYGHLILLLFIQAFNITELIIQG